MTKVFLNYYKARDYAEKHNLKECAYGDSDENVSYCAWNKSGDSYDEWEVEAYYLWNRVKVEKNGREYMSSRPEKETSPSLLNWAKIVLGLTQEELEV